MPSSLQRRLHTFKGWPHNCSLPSPDKLVHAGFYYTKEKDAVQCATCGIKIANWQPEDDPIAEHKKFSPKCHYLMKLAGVPVAEDTCGKYGIPPSTRPPPPPPPHHYRFIEDDRRPLRPRFTETTDRVKGPHYPMLARKEERLRTFKNWPKSIKQKPAELAEAGFFYMNVGDKTICFYCGVGCKAWEEQDVPWEEHAKWSPDCGYVQLHKGKEFIDKFRLGHQHAEEAAAGKSQAAEVEPQREEGKQIDDRVLCKVCLDKEMGVVFRPCGHGACLECAPALKVCHICRTPIEEYIRIFMA